MPEKLFTLSSQYIHFCVFASQIYKQGKNIVLWSQRSPDLASADIYLWCHLNTIVYWKGLRTRDEFGRLIRANATSLRVTGVYYSSENT